MRFYKKKGYLKWYAALDTMTRVQALTKIDQQPYFYGCGQNNFKDRNVDEKTAERENEGWIFRMDQSGVLEWMMKIAGNHPEGGKPSDNCLALS